jgi:hypothetical protein
MSQIFNVYCDESCHLEKDHQPSMILGAVWCPLEETHAISVRIREIKARHDLKPDFEIKWTKVSPAKLQFYLDIMDYFFDDDDLHFRALVVPDKSKLDHEAFGQTHDDWYYKMYFDMLKVLFSPDARYRIYLDMYDFSRQIIERVQTVRSHEVEMLQLADLLIGTVSYVNRGFTTSSAKLTLVERMRERSGYSLTRTTLYLEDKVNLFRWRASEGQL